MTPFILALVAALVLAAAFAGIYRIARRIDNYGIVDVAWPYAFSVVGLLYAFGADGWAPRRILVGAMAVLWSVRLGTHLYKRVIGHHPVEDARYQQLRRDWAANFNSKMAQFFQMQAFSVVLLAIPFLIVASNPSPGFSAFEAAGVIVWVIALAGESIADAQLRAFKANPANRGRVCEAGLWHYSRHPNYFFEWLVWVAFLVLALGSPWGWLAVLSPAIMLYLLLRVTGIPMTEEQAVLSKGEAYRTYQRTTSAFVPWFRKAAGNK